MALGMFGAPKVPGMTVLKPGASSFAPVDKPTGFGATGYGAPPKPYTPVSTTTSTGSASAAAQGFTTGGAAKTASAGSTPFGTTSAPKSPPPGGGGGSGSGSSGSQSIYSLDTDPIVAKIKALNAQNYANAVSQAQSTAKQDLIDSGFSLADIIQAHPELANSPIGSVLGDQATSLAAQQNPYSTLAGLNRANQQANRTIDQTTNDNNLFYSSTRGNELGDQSHAYLGNVSSARGSLADALAQLLTGLSSEQNAENQSLADAYDTARQNAVTNGIGSGEVLLGYDGNGNPIFGPAAGSGGGSGGGGDSTGSGAGAGPPAASPAAPATHATGLQVTQPLHPVNPIAAAVAKAVTANKTGATVAKGRGVVSIH